MASGNDLRNLILKHNRRLQKLREIQATKGIDTSPDVLIEIEDIEAKLEKLQTRLTQAEENKWAVQQGVTPSSALGQVHKLQLSSFRAIAKEVMKTKREQVATAHSFEFKEFCGEEEIGPSNVGTIGLANYFENGMVIWHDFGKCARQAFTVHGGIGFRYQAMGENRWRVLGFPTTDEKEAAISPFGTTGRYNLFEDGVIVWHSGGSFRDTSYAIWGSLASKYLALKGTASYLGFPISEPYLTEDGKRCDFEGGSIVHLNGDERAEVVRQLLRINYSDSPFNHEWKQYTGPTDPECISVRLGTAIGGSRSCIAFNFPWESRAVRYPERGYAPDELRERYCGITVKSLSPGKWIRFYLKAETGDYCHQYLEFDSVNQEKKLTTDNVENVQYWHIPLPKEIDDGEWHTLVIDLDSHVLEGFNKSYKWLRRFNFRGHIGIADLVVSTNREALEHIVIDPIRL